MVYEEPCRAISVGYNGYVDNSEDQHYGTYTILVQFYIPLHVHIRELGPLFILPVCCAEFNAIVSAYRYHADLTSATLYTTGVPCSRCATKIVQSGIKTVVYEEDEDVMEEEAKKIFYWGKVATM